MTTDLYSGTLRRRPVAMVPRVADAENRVKASYSGSSYFDDRIGHIDFELSDPGSVKRLDHDSVPDSSYEMPGGVLSHICHVLTKLPLLPLALKTELPIKYSTVHIGGNTQVCRHDCCWFSRTKPVGPKTPHHMHYGATCVTHQYSYQQA